jgi:tetratricopeptide (TPR) repeat protein
MTKRLLILFVGMLILRNVTTAHAVGDLTELVKTVQPAVVKIVVYDMNKTVSSIGSGFFVNDKGHLITNYHVLNGAFSADVIAHDGGKYPINFVIAQDRHSDLLKVKVDLPRMLIHWLNVTDKLPSIAEQVLVVGSPLGLEQSVSEGIVSGIREVPHLGNFFQTTAPISPGSSGSPVMDMQGNVVGVISFQSIFGQNLNFAISGEKVLKLQDHAFGKTLAEWTYSISSEKEKLAENLCRKGFQFAVNGEYKKALTFYKDAAETDPKDITAWYGLSQCYVGLDQPDQVVKTYKEAIRFHTNDASLHYYLGNYYNRLGKHAEAIAAYKEAVRISPNSAAAFDKLGLTYGKIGLYKKAIEAHNKVIRIKPRSASSHFQIGVVHGKLGNYQKAIVAYREAVTIDPDFAQAFNNMGLLLGKSGKHKEQLEAFKQAIRINPDDAFAHYNMGGAYVALDDRKSALQEYKILKKLDPEKAESLFKNIYK